MRVHDLVPEEVWQRRYDHIRDFEQMLADEGTVIRKFFLHISKDEQTRAAAGAARQPRKHWKFEHGDLEERKCWDDYTDGLRGGARPRRRPTTRPWYIVPVRPQVVPQPGDRPRSWSRPSSRSTLRYPEPAQGLDEHHDRLTRQHP